MQITQRRDHYKRGREGKISFNIKWLVAALFALTLTNTSSLALAETLNLVTNWGSGLYSVARTIKFAEEFNASGAAKAADLKIMFVGGPEVTPATQQLTALRNGVFDLLFGSAGYYVGDVPEAYAIYATSITPMEARETGATDLLDKIYLEKANAHVLGWVAAGVGYHIWLKDKPPLNKKGEPKLNGLKIRSSGFYKAWLSSHGATNVMIPAPDIYTSMERGIVDGAAWPGLGITDYGFEKFVGYRIDPPVWQFDNLLWINNDKWESLTEEQQKVLSESVRAYEPVAHAYYKKLAEEERAKVEAAGVKSFRMSADAEAAYVRAAQELQWQQVKNKAPDNYEALLAVMPASK